MDVFDICEECLGVPLYKPDKPKNPEEEPSNDESLFNLSTLMKKIKECYKKKETKVL